ncbi:MAG: hypothetical protein ACLQNE_22290 [Thermoguttaceae bacterium]|jgi:hypothetical protein
MEHPPTRLYTAMHRKRDGFVAEIRGRFLAIRKRRRKGWKRILAHSQAKWVFLPCDMVSGKLREPDVLSVIVAAIGNDDAEWHGSLEAAARAVTGKRRGKMPHVWDRKIL